MWSEMFVVFGAWCYCTYVVSAALSLSPRRDVALHILEPSVVVPHYHHDPSYYIRTTYVRRGRRGGEEEQQRGHHARSIPRNNEIMEWSARALSSAG